MHTGVRLHLSSMLALGGLVGCSAGVPGTSGDPTFGPVDPTGRPATSSATTEDDPTTGGLGETDDNMRPDDSTGPADTSGTTTTPGDTSTGPGEGSSSSGGGPMCGDGVAQAGEDCDGADLGGLTCADVDAMFTGGTLACDGGCTFDTSGCTSAQNPIVQCQVVNAAIPDDSPVGVTDTIVLPPEVLGGTITDVDVDVELDHTYLGDLLIDVTHAGTSVLLHNRCGTEEDLDVTYDDEAAAAFNCAQSNQGLVVQPVGSLTTLDGVAVGSNWTLFVEDELAADTGTLTQWCVTISWM